MNKNNTTKLSAGNDESRVYKRETIQNSAVYAKASKSKNLPRLHYLIFWKKYLKEKNIWELVLAIQYFKKLMSSFYKDHPNKSTATSESIKMPLSIAIPIVRPTTITTRPSKQKKRRLANNLNK